MNFVYLPIKGRNAYLFLNLIIVCMSQRLKTATFQALGFFLCTLDLIDVYSDTLLV